MSSGRGEQGTAPTATRPPAYVVAGEDASLVGEAARELIRDLVGQEDPALVVEEHGTEDDPDMGSILDACATPPFLASHRVVVVRDAVGCGRTRSVRSSRISRTLSRRPRSCSSPVAGPSRAGWSMPCANAVR